MSDENKNNEFSFENPEYRKTYWHTCSHVMAQAVKRLWPEVKLAIGPSIDEGWYYDLDSPFPFTPRAPGADRGGDAQDLQGEAQAGAVRAAPGGGPEVHGGKGEPFKVELIQDLPEDAHISSISRGSSPTCAPAPPPGLHRAHQGQRPEAHRLQRRLLAGGLQPGDSPAHLRHRLPQEGRAGRVPGPGSKRPRSGTIGSWVRSWACSCCGTRAPASPSSSPRAWC